MRIAALSDFHVGAREGTDGFRHDLDAFARRLDALEQEHGTIVLLGDIYQTDHTALPSRRSAARHLRAARERLGSLTARFDAPPYVYVHGNHDEVAATELDAPTQVRLGEDGCGALFIHGHQFDPIAAGVPWAADLGTWSTGRLRRAGLRPLAEWFEHRDVTIKHGRFGRPGGPYDAGALALAQEHRSRIVVMGHTHVPFARRLADGTLHVNTGTCSRGRYMVASIDTDEGTAEIRTPDGTTRLSLGGSRSR